MLQTDFCMNSVFLWIILYTQVLHFIGYNFSKHCAIVSITVFWRLLQVRIIMFILKALSNVIGILKRIVRSSNEIIPLHSLKFLIDWDFFVILFAGWHLILDWVSWVNIVVDSKYFQNQCKIYKMWSILFEPVNWKMVTRNFHL